MKRLDRTPPAWAADYVGLPWKPGGRDRAGLDCWGLVRLVLAERYGIALPAYEGLTPERRAEASDVMARDLAKLGVAVRVEQARAGDVVLYRVGQAPLHVGVLIAADCVLHIEAGTGSIAGRLDDLAWRKRILGFYRPRVALEGFAGPFDTEAARGMEEGASAPVMVSSGGIVAGARRFMAVAEGRSIEDILAQVQPDPAVRALARAWIGEHEIPPDLWRSVRPREWCSGLTQS